MKLLVNNKEYHFNVSLTLQELLGVLSISTAGTAIAVNDAIITRTKWQSHALIEGDKITLIRATAGG